MHRFFEWLHEVDAAVGLFLLGALGGLIMWAKKQTIDNVYATKEEVRKTEERLENRMDIHEKADVARYDELQKTIAHNHDEMKTLIITQIVGRRED
jgi:hypothetical protein